MGAVLDPTFSGGRKWGPGSDLYLSDERLDLGMLNGTHQLTFNLFSADEAQLMILTANSYRRQEEPLDQEDLAAALLVLGSLEDMYLIYNCSPAGGCSRAHKHMQALRGPPFSFEGLLNGSVKAPFQYFAHRVDPGFRDTAVSDLHVMYISLLDQARNVLGLGSRDVCPHNLVMWKDWIFVIPRTKPGTGKPCTNAAGMFGSIWVPDQENVDKWMIHGGILALQALGVPMSTRLQSYGELN